MYAGNDSWLGNRQQVVVALYIGMPILEALTPVIRFLEFMTLYHGSHGAIYDENTFLKFLSDIHIISY
jgi:hypothetical protein